MLPQSREFIISVASGIASSIVRLRQTHAWVHVNTFAFFAPLPARCLAALHLPLDERGVQSIWLHLSPQLLAIIHVHVYFIESQKLKHQCNPCALPRLMMPFITPNTSCSKVTCTFHKESMEMPLTTKNLVCVTSTCAPCAKMGWTKFTRVDEGHVISRNAQCAVYSNRRCTSTCTKWGWLSSVKWQGPAYSQGLLAC